MHVCCAPSSGWPRISYRNTPFLLGYSCYSCAGEKVQELACNVLDGSRTLTAAGEWEQDVSLSRPFFEPARPMPPRAALELAEASAARPRDVWTDDKWACIGHTSAAWMMYTNVDDAQLQGLLTSIQTSDGEGQLPPLPAHNWNILHAKPLLLKEWADAVVAGCGVTPFASGSAKNPSARGVHEHAEEHAVKAALATGGNFLTLFVTRESCTETMADGITRRSKPWHPCGGETCVPCDTLLLNLAAEGKTSVLLVDSLLSSGGIGGRVRLARIGETVWTSYGKTAALRLGTAPSPVECDAPRPRETTEEALALQRDLRAMREAGPLPMPAVQIERTGGSFLYRDGEGYPYSIAM